MWNIGERMHVVPGDRLWLAVSLYWVLGCENALFNLITHAGCVILQEHFDAGEALREGGLGLGDFSPTLR